MGSGGGGWLSQTRPIPRPPDGDKKFTHSLLEILNFAKKKNFGTWVSKGQYCMVLGGGTGWALVILGQHREEPICL